MSKPEVTAGRKAYLRRHKVETRLKRDTHPNLGDTGEWEYLYFPFYICVLYGQKYAIV